MEHGLEVCYEVWNRLHEAIQNNKDATTMSLPQVPSIYLWMVETITAQGLVEMVEETPVVEQRQEWKPARVTILRWETMKGIP